MCAAELAAIVVGVDSEGTDSDIVGCCCCACATADVDGGADSDVTVETSCVALVASDE